MAVLSPVAKQQFFDNDGNPAAGYLLYTYATGTSTPLATYSDEDAATPNANPIVLDARGEATIYVPEGTAYSYVLKTAAAATVWTRDKVTAPSTSGVFVQQAAGAVTRSVQDKLRETISLLDFVPAVEHAAILAGSSTYDATADLLDAVTAAGGRPVIIPSGLVLVKALTADSAWLIGAGAGVTEIRLHGGGTEAVFIVGDLRLENLTLSDGGRASMDHTTTPEAVLATCVNGFDADRVAFVTDRCVLGQTATSDDSRTSVTRCSLARHTDAAADEADEMNMFVMSDVLRVHFSRLDATSLVGRSIVNATYSQTGAGVNAPATATVEHCNFDLFRHIAPATEVKVVFLQGYLADVEHNQFRDCFGRHVDILGNYNSTGTTSDGTFFKSVVANNKVDYTTANAAVTGADNDEAGSFYCRYADVEIHGNHLDYTNLLLSSNIYNSIAVRHGYKAAHVYANTIITPKAHAIECDISDAIDTDECNVYITDNVIQGATNPSRRPIEVANNTATWPSKAFDLVVIRGNSIEYSGDSTSISLEVAPASADVFGLNTLVIEDNWHKDVNKFDTVSFQMFPQRLKGRNVEATITVDPSAITSSAGVIYSLDDAIACIGTYECKSLTIALVAGHASVETVTGQTTLFAKPRNVTIEGNNGAGGRIRFYTAGGTQTGLFLTLDGNEIEFDACQFESDSGTSTTNLVRLDGFGHAYFNAPEARYGESFVLSAGPDFSIAGGTVNDIVLGSTSSRGILCVDSERLVRCSIDGTTGANNYRLYNCLSPALVVSENIGSLTVLEASVKSFTVVV